MGKKRTLRSKFVPPSEILHVEICKRPDFLPKNKPKGARRAGKLFEWKVLDYLEERYNSLLVPSPWFRYFTKQQNLPRYCQPDAIIFDLQKLHLSIIEVKLRHTIKAYYQLTQLYLPVLQKLLGKRFTYSCCEICKFFDPHEAFPIQVEFAPEPHLPGTEDLTVFLFQE